MNKVIIFGLDHYNSLGLARVFGINGIKPYGILVSCYKQHKNDFCYTSRFWESTWFVRSMNEGIDFIIKMFGNENEHNVIMPSADTAEEMIDKNIDRLIDNGFIVPGINQKQGEVNRLMNKKVQSDWVQALGIKTARTFMIDLYGSIDFLQFPYPCIIKPVISSEGKKLDIRKCSTHGELEVVLEELRKKGYRRILLQEFLDKDFEAELFGCIPIHSERIPFLLTEHLREWPSIGGSVSCHRFITDVKLKKQALLILKAIQKFGYRGNIDIELLIVNKEIYLNEINFRNSGDIYACFYNKVYYPVIWYLDAIGKDTTFYNIDYTDNKYAMNETTDIRHVIAGLIGIKEWLRYYKNSADYALKFKGDMKPALKRYFYYISKFVKEKRFNF